MIIVRKTIFLITTIALTFFTINIDAQEVYTPKNGDFLFQEGNTGDFEEAVKAVTPSWKGKHFSHVGTVYIHNGHIMVLEAIFEGVVATSYVDFLNRAVDKKGHPKVVVGRLKAQYQDIIDTAIQKMRNLIGKKYDYLFDMNNDSFYCSKLIYKCFTNKNNKPIFKLNPMTFIDPNTGILFEKWRTYFNALHAPVPEGQLGLNPGSMINESVINIIYSFY